MRVLIVDDEEMARRRLVRLVSSMPDVVLAGTCEDGAAAVARVYQGDVDVVLLDIHMPGLNGVEALGLIGDRAAVIFTTAHPQHSLPAFDGGAVDYVLKPVDPARLRTALDRVRLRTHTARPTRITIAVAGAMRLFDPDDLWAARVDGSSVLVLTSQGPLFTAERLSDLEVRLTDPPFVRVHRNALVHLGKVARLTELDSGGYDAVLPDGSVISVSRAFARDLRRRLGVAG